MEARQGDSRGNNGTHQRACFGSSTSEGVDFFCRRVNESVRFLVVGVGSAGVVGDASDDAVVDAPESTGVGNLSSGAASSPARGVLPLSPLPLLRLVNESERLSLVMTPGLAFAAAAASAC